MTNFSDEVERLNSTVQGLLNDSEEGAMTALVISGGIAARLLPEMMKNKETLELAQTITESLDDISMGDRLALIGSLYASVMLEAAGRIGSFEKIAKVAYPSGDNWDIIIDLSLSAGRARVGESEEAFDTSSNDSQSAD